MSARRLLLSVCVVLVLGGGLSAHATIPGPNGRIVFGSSRDGNAELYSVNADGGALRRLTWTPQTEQSPAWSPDGGRIAYESEPSGGRWRVWVMNADGSGQTQISPAGSDLVDDIDPAWSPDGTQIAFASTRAGTWNLWVMNADGSGLRQVSGVFATDPAWSPDGRRLAYVGSDGVGVVGVDGSNPHLVSAPGAFASGPSWSPDGSEIVFSRNNAQGYPGELYIANADGSGERQLTSDGFENARPSWSPDGTQIVFQRTAAAPSGWSLWAIGVDGTGLRQVTAGGSDLGPDWGSSQVVPEPSPPDAPTIQIFSPTDGAFYLPGTQVPAFYLCSSNVSFIVSCQGDLPVGALLDLSQAGMHTFTVHALDADGRTATTNGHLPGTRPGRAPDRPAHPEERRQLRPRRAGHDRLLLHRRSRRQRRRVLLGHRSKRRPARYLAGRQPRLHRARARQRRQPRNGYRDLHRRRTASDPAHLARGGSDVTRSERQPSPPTPARPRPASSSSAAPARSQTATASTPARSARRPSPSTPPTAAAERRP